MAAKNPRIQVSLDPETKEAIAFLAKRRHKTHSVIAKELIQQALELEEDLYWSKLVNERMEKNPNPKTYTFEEMCRKLDIKLDSHDSPSKTSKRSQKKSTQRSRERSKKD